MAPLSYLGDGLSVSQTTAYAWQLNSTYDMYLFIDPDDGNKIKCRDNRTGAIISSHATNADVPLQAAIDALSAGSTSSTNFWSGGKYGSIFVGPGSFTFYTAVILKSHIMIQGSGRWATTFTWPNNNLLGNHNQDIFKSSTWDANSTSTSVTGSTAGDNGIILRDFEIDGNWKNNVVPTINTATTTLVAGVETAGTDSWGHGIVVWGYDMICQNLNIHDCPGAGIILQGNIPSDVFPGGGYPYPQGTAAGRTGAITMSSFDNVRCWANGRQGLLLRGPAYVYNYWSWINGEAGIDTQTSAYFNSTPVWIDGIECFLDGYNYGPRLSTDTYNPLGFEIRISGTGCWMSNAWIEGPWGGLGNSLMVGDNGTAGSTGFQIRGTGGMSGHNIRLDGCRSSHLFIGSGSVGNSIARLEIQSNTLGNIYNPSVSVSPATIMSTFNNLEIHFDGFSDVPANNLVADGVVMSNNYNKITLFGVNEKYFVNNTSSGLINAFDITIADQAAGVSAVLNPAGFAFGSLCDVQVRTANNNTANLVKSHNGGSATLTGNGSTTVFNIAHKLFAAPSVYSARAGNAAAVTGGTYYLTADATNVTLTFTTAPPSSTMTFIWDARVSA